MLGILGKMGADVDEDSVKDSLRLRFRLISSEPISLP
jgi:hypothetical protein